jgi:uncharacterized protein (TIGR03083 family)
MPTSLSLAEHLDALEESGTRLGDLAGDAGLRAPVPTCPRWAVDDLVAHQAMVHRWATANIRGTDPGAVPNATEIRTTASDLIDYYRSGHAALLAALAEAPSDLAAQTFLRDAPPPREFWARRQAHETAIHMVDALAALCGRVPSAEEAGIGIELAVDGIDELLRGFLTRGRSKLYDNRELTIVVDPSDSDRRWVVHVAERLSVADGEAPARPDDTAATLHGTAAELYLGLWNRGDELSVSGDASILEHWRSTSRITWS